jgi:hypothetical protein
MVLAPISGYEEERGRLVDEVAIQVGLAEEERYAAWLQYMALRGVEEEGAEREEAARAAKAERQQRREQERRAMDALPSTIARLGEAPLATLLAALYPRWKCKVSGVRAGTQDELRGVVGASKASADAVLAREGTPTPHTLTQLRAAFVRGEGELERRVAGMGRVVKREGRQQQGEEGWCRAWMVDWGVVNEEAVERTIVEVVVEKAEGTEEEEEEEEVGIELDE